MTVNQIPCVGQLVQHNATSHKDVGYRNLKTNYVQCSVASWQKTDSWQQSSNDNS